MSDPLPLVVANLKANKNWEEISDWIFNVIDEANKFRGTIIFCPSHPFLAAAYHQISEKKTRLKLGAQDISKFEQGAYTGEVAASQIKDLVGYSLIGHSERRHNFAEDENSLKIKVSFAQISQIEPIFCVQDANTPIVEKVSIVAYEPPFAIGTGIPDTIENITKVVQAIKQKGPYTVLYGGSVSKENAKQIIDSGADGLLVGATNSLNPQKFIEIIKSL